MKKNFPMKRVKIEAGAPHPMQFMASGGLFGNIADQFTTTNDYNANLAPTQQSNYGSTINNAGANSLAGYGTFQGNQQEQQGLVNSLQNQVNGTGANPAQAMLAQNTGNNVAQQAALIAGQRGAGANAGLMARQAAMAGGAAQQQAAGQAATLQAQQSLAAQAQQGQVLGQMGSQNIAEQGANNGLFGAASGAQNTQNYGNISNYGMAQGLNQKTAQNNTDAINKTEGGFLNGIGGVASFIGLAKGGMVPDHLKALHAIYHAQGGMVASANAPDNFQRTTDAIYRTRAKNMGAENDMNVATDTYQPREMHAMQKQAPASGGSMQLANDPGNYAEGGEIGSQDSDLFSRHSAAISRNMVGKNRAEMGDDANDEMTGDDVEATRRGGLETGGEKVDTQPVASQNIEMRNGGRVPGTPKVARNDLKNDVQPAMLTPKEIVLPLSVTLAPDAPEKAAQFVAAILKKQGHGNSSHHKEFKKALEKAILNRKRK